MTRIALPVPTSQDLVYNRDNWGVYAEVLRSVGGQAVEFPLNLTRSERIGLAGTCDGILLPGSPADIDPKRYGQEREPATAECDMAREETDFFLLDHAERARIPLLGVCFGLQSMNVYRGGTLLQDLSSQPVPHSNERAVLQAHAVVIERHSRLAKLTSAEETESEFNLMVNSSHHQAIGIPGKGLSVSARCPQDGVIEALEDLRSEACFLGVQWHPERTFSASALSASLFSAFVGEAALVGDRVSFPSWRY